MYGSLRAAVVLFFALFTFTVSAAIFNNSDPALTISQICACAEEQPLDAPDFLHQHEKRVGSGGAYWYSQIKRQGKVAYGFNSSYVIWRNVKDYGAKGTV